MDWLFERDRQICHVRVSGVLLLGDRILLQRCGDEYALPGGHLQFGETTQETLIREYKEETGLDIACDRLLWTEENFWTWGDKKAHNLGYYYLIHLLDGHEIPDGFHVLRDNGSVSYGWVNIADLGSLRVYPTFLAEELHRLSGAPRHFIRREA